jgi:transposase, IS30 family
VRRRHRYQRFSETQQDEIWRLVASGERYVDVAAAVGGTRQGVRALLGRTGGLRPRPRHRSPRHLSALEREEISRALPNGTSLRGIAARLGRAPSSIAREVRRNGGRAAYRAVHADRRASDRGRRPKVAKLVRQPQLRSAVEGRLARRWSPQQIAVSLRRDYPDDPAMHVSHETIYQSLFVQSRGALRRELTRYLRRPRLQRRPPQRVDDRGRLPGMLNIRERPAEVADRAVPGHWEGDLLIGRGSRSAIGTLVERRTRFVLLLALPDGRSAPAVRDALTAQILTLPAQLRRSLTWDQGRELAEHARFTVDTGVAVYFCDPHSPWQRGSNENTNGLLRQYFPKNMDLSLVTQEQLDAVAAELNGRPRQTLGWMKPCEALAEVLR